MDRFPPETLTVNVWANALNQIVLSKSSKKKSTKSERMKILKQNIDFLVNILKQVLAKCNQEKNRKDDLVRAEIFGH